MARLLSNSSGKTPVSSRSARGFVVRGARFVNSAAKFWPSLVDEWAADYPACDALVLEMLTDLALDRDLLFPETALQRELDQRREPGDWRAALRESLAQCDLIGPPGAVHVRLLAGAVAKKACDLPLDCVDADIFPCLLVWLLEWAEIPHCLWNDPELNGEFCARDCEREISYRLQFNLIREHVSEGLFRCALTLRYTRQA